MNTKYDWESLNDGRVHRWLGCQSIGSIRTMIYREAKKRGRSAHVYRTDEGDVMFYTEAK